MSYTMLWNCNMTACTKAMLLRELGMLPVEVEDTFALPDAAGKYPVKKGVEVVGFYNNRDYFSFGVFTDTADRTAVQNAREYMVGVCRILQNIGKRIVKKTKEVNCGKNNNQSGANLVKSV